MAGVQTIWNRRRSTWIGLLVVAGAVALRWLYFQERRDVPDFAYPDVDALYHDYWARGLAFDRWTPPPGMEDPGVRIRPYFRPPGYPYFLAATYRFGGGSYAAPRVVQHVLGVLGVALAWWLGARLGGRLAGALYAALMGSYWILLYFEGELLDPALNVFLLVAMVAAGLLWLERRRAGWIFLAGLLLGLAAVVRPNVLAFFPAGLAWLGWVLKRRGDWLRAAGLWTAGLVLAVAPAAARNRVVAQDRVLISSNAGVNFYIGNNPDATGYCMAELPAWGPYRTCFDYPRICREVARQAGRPLKDSEISGFFFAEGTRWARAHPGRFGELLAKKAVLFWGRPEVAHNTVESQGRRTSRILRWLPGDFPLFLCLGFLGAASLGRNGSRSARHMAVFMGLFVAAYFLSVWPFFAAARYRVPLLPFILFFAAAGVRRLAVWIQARAWRRLAGSAVALLPLYGVLAWNWTGYREPLGRWHFDLGWALVKQGRLAEAQEQFRRALAEDPEDVRARINLGNVLGQTGDLTGAEREFRRALATGENSETLNNLGYTLQLQGRWAESLPYFDRALALDPENGQARNNRRAALAALDAARQGNSAP